MLLCQYSTRVLADNLMYMTGPNTKPGQMVELTLNLRNTDPVVGWACALYFPEGVVFNQLNVDTNRYPKIPEEYHSFPTNDGGTLFFVSSGTSSNSCLIGTDGAIAKISISVSDDLAPGEYSIEIKKISLASPVDDTGLSVSLPVNETSTFTLKVVDPDASTLIFDSNGGSAIDSITQKNGSTITPPANPTREGYTFIGWEPAIPDTMPMGGLTVTAQWQINQHTATFTIPSENWTEVLTLDYGSEISAPIPPKKPGFTFDGWDKPIPETMPDADLVFTGSYTQNFLTLSLTATGNGTVRYGNTSVRSSSQSFDVAELSEVVLTVTPDFGHHVETLTINGEDALSQMTDGKLNIGSMTASVTVAVTFANNSDLNNDGLVDVGDIMTIINYIADDIYFAEADLNNDGFVDVGDIMVVINTIIGIHDNTAGVKAMRDVTNSMPATENDDYLTISNEDNIVSIQLDNEYEYSAFQMLVTLPDGVDIDDVIFNSDRLNGFTQFARKVNERQYIIIGFSMGGNVITGSAGKILSLSITGDANDNIIISNPIFSIPEAKSYKLRVDDSYTTNLQGIQLSQISVRGNTVYIHANNDTTLNIYTVSGALCEQKHLHPGVNTITLRRGQYIINNHKVTISK